MRLSAIMTPAPRCVRPETELDEALAVMDTGYVRHLPVVSEAGRLIGLVSDRDLLQATGWLPSERDLGEENGRRRRGGTVAEIMTRTVVTASPDDTVVTAAVDLAGRHIGCLPIVQADILVGIVSEMDVVSSFAHRAIQTADDNPPIERVMTWHPTTTETDASLAETRRLMRINEIRHLPVVHQGRLAGMLSDRDLRRAYGAGRSKDTEVEEVMTRDVVLLTTEATAKDAALALVRHRISAVPIVTAGAVPTLVGIVTVSDLLDHCLSTLRDNESPTSIA